MVKRILILWILFLLPSLAIAEDFMCPTSVTINDGITNKPSGWSSYVNKSKASMRENGSYLLSKVEFSQYDDIGFLSPSNEVEKGNIVQYRWQLTNHNEYDIDCLYQPILTHLTRKLPKGLKACEVTYQKSESGKLSFNTARCY